MIGALLEVAVTEDLQVDQAQADDGAPEQEDSAQKVKAVIPGAGLAC